MSKEATGSGKLSEEGGVMDFFAFRTMVSGYIIKALYLLGALGILLIGIRLIWTGVASSFQLYSASEWHVLLRDEALWRDAGTGLLLLVVGNVVWRVLCETMILLFSLHEIVGSLEKTVG